MTTESAFVDWALRKLNQQNDRVQACLHRLTDDQMWWRGSENENAIGNLILHLCGNMRQWIGTGVAGLADTRDRDSQFNTRGGVKRDALTMMLTETVADTSKVIRDLHPARLPEKIIPVQGYDVTVVEAVGHVVEHFGYHTG